MTTTVLSNALREIVKVQQTKQASIGDQVIKNAFVKLAINDPKKPKKPVKDDSGDKEKSNETYSNMDKEKPSEKPDYSTTNNTDNSGVPNFSKERDNKQKNPAPRVAGTKTPENEARGKRNNEGVATFDADTEKNKGYDRDINKSQQKTEEELAGLRGFKNNVETAGAYGAGTLGGAGIGAAIGAAAGSPKNRGKNALIGGGIGAAGGAGATAVYRNRKEILNGLKKLIGSTK